MSYFQQIFGQKNLDPKKTGSQKIESHLNLWILSSVIALLLHGGVVFYSTTPIVGARALGVGGIDIGLGASGRVAGQNNQHGVDEKAAKERQGDGKLKQEEKPPVKKNPAPSNKKKALIKKPKKDIQKNTPPLKQTPPSVENTQAETGQASDNKTSEMREEKKKETGTGLTSEKQIKEGGQGGVSGINGKDQAGIGDGGRGGGSPGDVAAYYSTLQQWIQRHQTYPAKARRLKQQGVALVKLGITAEGKLLFARIVKSSGFPLLDKAALAAIHASAPLIPIPKHFHKNMMTLIIPMQFILT